MLLYRKCIFRVEEVRQFYKFRPDEIFRRVHLNNLVNLMIEVSKLEMHKSDLLMEDEDEQSDSADSAIEDFDLESVQQFRRNTGMSYSCRSSSVADLVQGIGEMDLEPFDSVSNVGGIETNSGRNDRPFLILDVRDVEDFEMLHIVSAESYPMSRLSRSINFESKSMLRFKNRDGKIIVVYDNDEVLAAKSATTLVERGYENVFMLSGGIKVAKMKFPHELFTNNAEKTDLDEDDVLALEEQLEANLKSRSRSRSSRLHSGMSMSQPNLNFDQRSIISRRF